MMLHTKYEGSRPCGFRPEEFHFFPYIRLCKTCDSLGGPIFSPRGIQSNLDYSNCQGPQESFRIIGSSNDRKWEFSDIFGKAWTFHRTPLFCQSL